MYAQQQTGWAAAAQAPVPVPRPAQPQQQQQQLMQQPPVGAGYAQQQQQQQQQQQAPAQASQQQQQQQAAAAGGQQRHWTPQSLNLYYKAALVESAPLAPFLVQAREYLAAAPPGTVNPDLPAAITTVSPFC
jgi:hypothetical protein